MTLEGANTLTVTKERSEVATEILYQTSRITKKYEAELAKFTTNITDNPDSFPYYVSWADGLVVAGHEAKIVSWFLAISDAELDEISDELLIAHTTWCIEYLTKCLVENKFEARSTGALDRVVADKERQATANLIAVLTKCLAVAND